MSLVALYDIGIYAFRKLGSLSLDFKIPQAPGYLFIGRGIYFGLPAESKAIK